MTEKTPIDQIRKALESDHPREDIDLRDVAQLVNENAQLKRERDAAVQRAAEMQERCAQEVERVGPHDGPPALITAGFAAAIRAIKE